MSNIQTHPRLQAGQKARLTIEVLVAGGDGLARHNGMPIFVSRTVPGDVAEIEIFDARKDFARGRVVGMIEPSSQRVEAPCKLFKVCGGCQWQHMTYEAQLQYKQEIVRQAVKRASAIEPEVVLPTMGAVEPFYYRNKVQFPVKNPQDSKRLLAGYYEQDSHELVNIKHCPVQPKAFDYLLAQVKEHAEAHDITAYEERTQTGILRHVCIRGADNGELLLTLVVNLKCDMRQQGAPQIRKTKSTSRKLQQEDVPANIRALAHTLKSHNPNLVGVCVNFNDRPGNRIYGDVTKILEGRDFIIDHLISHYDNAPDQLRKGLSFQVSATSFFQINRPQTERMLDVILEGATSKFQRAPLIVDAYAGVGTIALWLAFTATRIIAIEESAQAASDAAANIKLNQTTNVDFRQGSVEEILSKLIAQDEKPDIVILDPPRKGVSDKVIECVLKLHPSRIIYVSCNPATFARDLDKLDRQGGYKTISIQPIDMFPQTFHVESVSVLERVS